MDAGIKPQLPDGLQQVVSVSAGAFQEVGTKLWAARWKM